MPKKFLIPIIISIVAVLSIIFAIVYKQTSKDPFENTEVVETLPPKETDEIITKTDKTETDPSDLDFEVPTIAVTEAVINGEKQEVGVVETLEDNSYIGIAKSGDVIVSLKLPQLSSGHQYSEAEAVALDNLTYYWSEHNISKEDLAAKLEDEVYDGLSDADKAEIVEEIYEREPHEAPDETLEQVPETGASEEVARDEQIGMELFDFGGSGGQVAPEDRLDNSELQSN